MRMIHRGTPFRRIFWASELEKKLEDLDILGLKAATETQGSAMSEQGEDTLTLEKIFEH